MGRIQSSTSATYFRRSTFTKQPDFEIDSTTRLRENYSIDADSERNSGKTTMIARRKSFNLIFQGKIFFANFNIIQAEDRIQLNHELSQTATHFNQCRVYQRNLDSCVRAAQFWGLK